MEIKKEKFEKKPKRAELSGKEILKRMEDIPKRMEKIIAALRKVKN